jgi:hypothetical protein
MEAMEGRGGVEKGRRGGGEGRREEGRGGRGVEKPLIANQFTSQITPPSLRAREFKMT